MLRRFAKPFLVLFGIALLAGAARAEDEVAKARALFAEGQAEYNLGHFAKALELYEGAYKHKAVPGLLFNIAQCHRQLGDMKNAASTYKAFLRTTSKKDPNRAQAEVLLREVEGAVRKNEEAQTARPLGAVPKGEGEENKLNADHDAPPQVAPTEVPATAVPASETASRAEPAVSKEPVAQELATSLPRSTSAPVASVQTPAETSAPAKSGRTWTWVAAGGTGVALAVGGLYGLKSKSTASELQSSQHTTAEVNSKKAQVSSDAGKANLLFGVGVGLAAVTTALFVLEF